MEKEYKEKERMENLKSEYPEFKLLFGSRKILFEPKFISWAYDNGYLIRMVENIRNDMKEYDCNKALRLYFQILKEDGFKKNILCIKIGKRVYKINLFNIMMENDLSTTNETIQYLSEDIESIVERFEIVF